jgi:hypothetical protein
VDSLSDNGSSSNPLPRGYSEQQAARLLTEAGWEITARTLRRAREAQAISFHQFGGKVRYTEADLLAYIERGRATATTAKPSPATGAPPPQPRPATSSPSQSTELTDEQCRQLWDMRAQKRKPRR